MTGRSIRAGSVVGLWVAAVVTAGGCAPSDQTTSVASVPAVRDPDTPTTVPPTVVLLHPQHLGQPSSCLATERMPDKEAGGGSLLQRWMD